MDASTPIARDQIDMKNMLFFIVLCLLGSIIVAAFFVFIMNRLGTYSAQQNVLFFLLIGVTTMIFLVIQDRTSS